MESERQSCAIIARPHSNKLPIQTTNHQDDEFIDCLPFTRNYRFRGCIIPDIRGNIWQISKDKISTFQRNQFTTDPFDGNRNFPDWTRQSGNEGRRFSKQPFGNNNNNNNNNGNANGFNQRGRFSGRLGNNNVDGSSEEKGQTRGSSGRSNQSGNNFGRNGGQNQRGGFGGFSGGFNSNRNGNGFGSSNFPGKFALFFETSNWLKFQVSAKEVASMETAIDLSGLSDRVKDSATLEDIEIE